MTKDQIEAYMLEAILEGQKARDKCAPNPPVGCVMVRDGIVIARGHTNEPGQPHAEAMALQQLDDGTGVTAFVTLEPCSFQGRTPSCAKALVAAGIERVYVGMIDPHPKNQGAGIKILRDAGIFVEVGILQETVSEELAPFLLT